MTKILKQCLYCECDFYTSQGQLNAGYGKFCSRACSSKYKTLKNNIELTCACCGKIYTRRRSVANNSMFCSRTCMDQSRDGKIEIICDYCGQKFKQYKSVYNRKDKTHHYCSVSCSAKGNNYLKIGKSKPNHINIDGICYVKFTCDYCKEEAFQKRDNYNINGLHHFCNKVCEGRHKSKNKSGENSYLWKGGITELNQAIRNLIEYKDWRTKCFERDNYICGVCGVKGTYLNVHHINRFSNILNTNKIKSIDDAKKCNELWDINNGITLCENCHKMETIKIRR